MLDGIKVLEVGNWVAVPSACAILSDLGAVVTKIEHPETGDPVRGINITRNGVVPAEPGLNPFFELLNRGKRSVATDLGTAGGQQIVRRLAQESDILVTNLTPHRQRRYSLQYEDLSSSNPGLIYAVLTGYGMEGAERDRSGFDYTAFWARSGIMASLGPRGGNPVQERPAMGDQTTSLGITAAVGLALYERQRSGRGQRVDLSLLNTGLWVIGGDVVGALRGRQAVLRHDRKNVPNPMFNFYKAQDGKWVQLVMPDSDRFWPGFCRALGLDDLEDDPRFDSHQNRTKNNRALIRLLEERIATRPRAEWAPPLDEAGSIWGPVQTLDEVIVDPQIEANDYVASIEHPTEGEYELLRLPMKVDRTPGSPKAPAPELGQDTETTLLEIGYSWEEISGLKDAGAIP